MMRWSEISKRWRYLKEMHDDLLEQQRAADDDPKLGPPDLFAFVEHVAAALPPSMWRTALQTQVGLYRAIIQHVAAWGCATGSRLPTPAERAQHGATLVVYFNGGSNE